MNLRLRQIDYRNSSQLEQNSAIVNYCELMDHDSVDNYYVVLEQWSDFKQEWEIVPLFHDEGPGSG